MRLVRAKALGIWFGGRRAIDIVAEAAEEREAEIVEETEGRGLGLVDTILPIVRKSRKAAQGLCADGFGVIIYGEEDHPEVPLSNRMAA